MDTVRETEYLAAELGRAWHLNLGASLAGASCSLVLEATDEDGRDLVLKVPEPHAEEKDSLPALLAFSSHGGVTVLRHDAGSGAILMPRLRPGSDLDNSDLTDLQRVDVASDLILGIRSAVGTIKFGIEPWFRELFEDNGNGLATEARRIARQLIDSSPQPTLCHGDLHHGNILANGESWVVVDPKGVMADPAFEIAAYMRNPVPNPPDAKGMSSRLWRFADRLGDPPERLWGWSFVQTVISCIWSDTNTFGSCWQQASESIWNCRGEFSKS